MFIERPSAYSYQLSNYDDDGSKNSGTFLSYVLFQPVPAAARIASQKGRVLIGGHIL
jgi:hypothetical protein